MVVEVRLVQGISPRLLCILIKDNVGFLPGGRKPRRLKQLQEGRGKDPCQCETLSAFWHGQALFAEELVQGDEVGRRDWPVRVLVYEVLAVILWQVSTACPICLV